MTSFEWPPEGSGSGGGVTSLNGDMGDILLVSLDGSISITPDTPSRGDINLESMGKISSINADSTPDQILDVGTAGSDFNIADSTRGEHTFNLPDASASSRGALTSGDWSTFDGKQDALILGDLTSTPTTNLVVTGGSGAVVGSGALLTLTGASLVEATSSVLTITGASNAVLGTGVSIAVKEAGTSQDGYLSSTDWNTFNSKGSGTVTGISVATANGLAGSSSGGATPALTLSTTLTTPVIAGNGTALIAATTTGSGSVVLGTAPTITLPNATGLPLTTGVTGVLPIANGGTDNGFLAVTAGGVFYSDGTKFQNVGAGTSGNFLKSNGSSAPAWASPTITLTAPTVTFLTSSSGNYSVPAGTLYLYIEAVGSGGGGGGGGDSTHAGSNGTAGGSATFGSTAVVAGGGGAGSFNGIGGAGGTGSLGSGVTGNCWAGGSGNGSSVVSTATGASSGSPGPGSGWGNGGNAMAYSGSGGQNGGANTGAGGPGGGPGTTAAQFGYSGASGGAGAFCKAWISGSTLSGLGSTIAYTNSSGGAGGAGAGGGGGAGSGGTSAILVVAYFQ